ncbi:DUF6383 domain-containing protein [Parabacteroides sp. AM08-6]|uniref:DUF6383 domain-containing protein n=1 Tax=Parabacteroides sp. AM08-6 TaxID=2292053 RepID=UPI000EFEC3C1|nr:DUF6383 domain-containing protein [Parabacteroides sp. AM08-6]RHJ78543.1 hypothetical protein DW103_14760 [Parabacteroides sp. AM08-6]
MNKKFSTLLASVLLVGSSFSAMANKVVTETSVYYQLKVGDKVLVIEEGTAKDSLALIEAPDVKTASLVDYNASLWRLEAKESTDESTGAKTAILKFVNKAGKTLSLSNESPANKTFYYSKPAYVKAGGVSSFAFLASQVAFEDGKLMVEADGINLQSYSYKDGKSTGLFLCTQTDPVDIKIKKVEAEGAIANATLPIETGFEEVKIVLTKAVDGLALGIDDLNKVDDDVEAFQLKFTPDTLGSTIGNPFTDNKLVAVKLASMYSAAVYDTEDYDDALAAAKEATTEANTAIDAAWTAFKAEVDEAIKWGKANEFNGKLFEKAGNATAITAALKALGTAGGSDNGALNKLTATVSTAGAAFKNAIDSLKEVGTSASAKLDETSTDYKNFKTALNGADTTWRGLKDSLSVSYSAIEKAVTKFVANPNQTSTSAVPDFTTDPADAVRLAALKSAGAVYVQYATTEAGALNTLATTASTLKVTTASKDIVDSGADAEGYYALAIKDSLIEGKQAFLYVDTAEYIAKNEKYFGFKADTLKRLDPTKTLEEGGAIADGMSINLFAFQLVANPQKVGADEILINTWVSNADGSNVEEASVVLRTLANNHREVSVAAESDALYAELLKNTVITFNQVVRETAQLEKGTAYYVKSMSKKDEAKPYIVMTSTSDCEDIMSANVYVNVPSTQWFVSEADDEASEYTIVNRDFENPLIEAQKFYVIDAEEGIYEADGDTIQLVEVEGTPDGYKNLTKEAIDHQTYKLTATNFANPTTTFYLTMKADSSVVMTDDAEKALVFKLKDMVAQELADNSLTANAYNGEVYFGNDTLFFTLEEPSLQIMLTKDAEKAISSEAAKAGLVFRRTSDKAGQYELLLMGAEDFRCGALKVGVDQNGNAVVVTPFDITNWAFDLAAATTETYLNVTDAPKNVTISLMGDDASMITAVKPFAAIKRTGLELKAAATDNDFVLGLDTAYVDRKDNFRYAYYITKAVDTEKVGSFDRKAYMVSYADSVKNASKDKEIYSQDGLTRVGFVYAKRVDNASGDSLAIERIPTKADTLDVAKENGITDATWAFAIDKDNEGYYRIEVAPAGDVKKDKNYLSYLNGILVLGNRAQAQLFAINDTKLAPTDNDNVSVSEVSVIASEGKVTISGAAGKKVVISNMLGQVKANAILASDNETIAVPAGVVVVAVEGEEAVKAIVE